MSARRRVLIIDDSEISLHFIASVLEQYGFEVKTATSVAGLDATLGSWTPDIILTDVSMPDLTGPELCRQLKAQYETAHVPVVLFSSMSAEELEPLAEECGADGFLSKINGLDKIGDELALVCDELVW